MILLFMNGCIRSLICVLSAWLLADMAFPLRTLAQPLAQPLVPGTGIRLLDHEGWEIYRWQIVTIAAAFLFQSALIGWLIFERHRRQNAEAEARRRLMDAAQMDRALTAGTMSASLAHELNQPLSAILSNAEAAEMMLMASAPDLNELKEILADIRRDDQRAAEIIRNLRRLMKRGDLDVEAVDLNELILGTARMLKHEAADRGVGLTIDCGADEVHCRTNAVCLQQVLLNLAINAMDAMAESPRERRLMFRISAKDECQVTVSVADTGIGIPEDRLKGIFEPLVTTKQQGTGLGLSIARTIISELGGKIWAENRAAGGAIFHFTVPRMPAGSGAAHHSDGDVARLL